MPTVATPNLSVGPGYLFWAPLATAEPTNTVTGSKFTDAWPGAWLPLGATTEGSVFTYGIETDTITPAEFFDPVKIVTTSRAGHIEFTLMDYTLTNLKRAMNGGALTVVSGTGATTLNKFEAPDPGTEVRAMIGFESAESDVRIIMRQCINSGDIAIPFRKAPDATEVPCDFQFEVPSAAKPFTFYSAGTLRG